jgi:transcriptional regulator with XRE-family HTH domain
MTISILSVKDLVKTARNGQSQHAFARMLGVQQSTISRYENGSASPSVRVIEQCMRLVHTLESQAPPSADELAERVRLSLSLPEHGRIRSALSSLIETVASETHGRARTETHLREAGD